MAQLLNKNRSLRHLSPLLCNQIFNNLKRNISNHKKKKKMREITSKRKATSFKLRDCVMSTKILNPILSIKSSHSYGANKRVNPMLSRF